jgi:glycerol uptake facilitator-like aquaporin
VSRRVFAEFLGAILLAAAVIGSGIMAERLSGGNAAISLLANTFASVAVLGVLISMLGPVSGAHLNPAITLVALARKAIGARESASFIIAQLLGCCAGALLAHSMFDVPLVQTSLHARTGGSQWISEIVATAGLVLVVFTSRSIGEAAWRVPAWIAGAYWFTASTSFANPAITVGRALSDSFAGIRGADVPGFVLAQLAGAVLGMVLLRILSARAEGTGLSAEREV